MSYSQKLKRVVLPAMIGNTLEFYDFTLYIFLTPILAPLFFPAADNATSVIAGLAAFALSFFMRPLGSLFFGYIGDKHSRKYALTLSIIMMAIPTGLMGLLPT